MNIEFFQWANLLNVDHRLSSSKVQTEEKIQVKRHKSSPKDLHTLFHILWSHSPHTHTHTQMTKCNNVKVIKNEKCEHDGKTFFFEKTDTYTSAPAGTLETICRNAQPAANS